MEPIQLHFRKQPRRKIGEGSVMILPANEVYISGIALKATTVTEDGEN